MNVGTPPTKYQLLTFDSPSLCRTFDIVSSLEGF